MNTSRFTFIISASLLSFAAVAQATPAMTDNEYKTVANDAAQVLALNDQGVDNRVGGGGGSGTGISDAGGTVGGAGGGGTGTGSPDGSIGAPVPPAN